MFNDLICEVRLGRVEMRIGVRFSVVYTPNIQESMFVYSQA